jgi:uncharacterized membrane protein YfcA
MPSALVMAVAGIAVLAGGLVQAGVGMGLGLIASPVITLLDPALMPGSLLVAGATLPALVLAREARHADWRGISWALAGRLAGTVSGIWVLSSVPLRLLGVLVGGIVLAAVAVTAVRAAVPRNRWTLLGAGVLSGSSATATSIGGPPVALLYQHEDGPRVRATLSAYFVAGNAIAVSALAVSGHLPGRDVAAGLVFIGCAVAGFTAAGWLRRFLDLGRTRAAVLTASAASAVLLIAHSLLG